MPVTPTYPGIYIEEVPSTNFVITPAPTSITVFVGYTHPYKTRPVNFAEKRAVRLFNFTDFEREYGGFLASGDFDGNVALAVSQFFRNGGSDLYVVGLKPSGLTDTLDPTETGVVAVDPTTVANPAATFTHLGGGGVTVFGLEPIDLADLIVEFVPKSGGKADVRVIYRTRTETFRDVLPTPKSLEDKVNKLSSLIRIRTDNTTAALPGDLDFKPGNNHRKTLAASPAAGPNVFSAADFTAVFQADTELDKVQVFNLLAVPGVSDFSVLDAARDFCEDKLAFLIVDPPPKADSTFTVPGTTTPLMDNGTIPKSTNAAIYFPYLISQHPVTGDRVDLPPSGTVAGVYARTDTQFGVWKAPAGLDASVNGVRGVVENGRLTEMRHGLLNQQGVNAIRTFPGVGSVVFGARTLRGGDAETAFQAWRYIPVRRMALFIEQTLKANLTWVVFRPNDEPLWAAIRASITGFMMSLFRQGALKGDSPSKAFQVKVDSETTTQTDIDLGIVNIVVAFAPLKPAEFVIIKIAQLAGQAEA